MVDTQEGNMKLMHNLSIINESIRESNVNPNLLLLGELKQHRSSLDVLLNYWKATEENNLMIQYILYHTPGINDTNKDFNRNICLKDKVSLYQDVKVLPNTNYTASINLIGLKDYTPRNFGEPTFDEDGTLVENEASETKEVERHAYLKVIELDKDDNELKTHSIEFTKSVVGKRQIITIETSESTVKLRYLIENDNYELQVEKAKLEASSYPTKFIRNENDINLEDEHSARNLIPQPNRISEFIMDKELFDKMNAKNLFPDYHADENIKITQSLITDYSQTQFGDKGYVFQVDFSSPVFTLIFSDDNGVLNPIMGGEDTEPFTLIFDVNGEVYEITKDHPIVLDYGKYHNAGTYYVTFTPPYAKAEGNYIASTISLRAVKYAYKTTLTRFTLVKQGYPYNTFIENNSSINDSMNNLIDKNQPPMIDIVEDKNMDDEITGYHIEYRYNVYNKNISPKTVYTVIVENTKDFPVCNAGDSDFEADSYILVDSNQMIAVSNVFYTTKKLKNITTFKMSNNIKHIEGSDKVELLTEPFSEFQLIIKIESDKYKTKADIPHDYQTIIKNIKFVRGLDVNPDF